MGNERGKNTAEEEQGEKLCFRQSDQGVMGFLKTIFGGELHIKRGWGRGCGPVLLLSFSILVSEEFPALNQLCIKDQITCDTSRPILTNSPCGNAVGKFPEPS